ncbi:hypothetical protein K0U00_41495, partial [Paenibacillus sepulcri]|nr:hypothetical protein [Paenibacillus sepulcri]
MTPRHTKRLLLLAIAAVLLGVSAQYGFGDAWASQYTYAFAPDKTDTSPKTPPPRINMPEPDP